MTEDLEGKFRELGTFMLNLLLNLTASSTNADMPAKTVVCSNCQTKFSFGKHKVLVLL